MADYRKITKLEPSQCDHHCVEGELSDSFTTDRAYFPESMGIDVRYFENANIKYQPRPQAPRLVFVRFYKDKLYRIVMNGVFTILPYFKDRYSNHLGPPNYEDKEGNEYNMASFGWEDERTKLFVVHTAGKVWIDSVQIQYVDKDILKQMPRNEDDE
ncbi:hypothetical protein D1BOALGB6SA_3049 [Olavius sp. associated proteobacterium Delta 1]|nr:hypothetical protein D1BOALGB6SA_3049 [Olavius sp. associated proteobacterium Delta 1]